MAKEKRPLLSQKAQVQRVDPLSLKVVFPTPPPVRSQIPSRIPSPNKLTNFFQKTLNKNIPAAIQERPKPVIRSPFVTRKQNPCRVYKNPNYDSETEGTPETRVRKISGKSFKMELDSESLKEITMEFLDEAIEKFIPENRTVMISYQFLKKYQDMIDAHVHEIGEGFHENEMIDDRYRKLISYDIENFLNSSSYQFPFSFLCVQAKPRN